MALHPPPHMFRPLWGGHNLTRPPNLPSSTLSPVIRPTRRNLSWAKEKALVYRKLARRRKYVTKGIWDHFPRFEDTSPTVVQEKEIYMRSRAAMKRWDGRRSMFLGNYKHRRDAAIAHQDNRGIPIENVKYPVIDGLFGERVDRAIDFPCVKTAEYTRRQFGIGEKFGMDFDLSGITLFITAAKRDLAGKTVDLGQPLPKVHFHKAKSTNWPDQARTRLLSKQLYKMIRDILREEMIIIRATYEFLIDNYLHRPYMPGLLRLLVHSLATKGEWALLGHLLCRAIHHKQPFLSNHNVGALVNYAISLSVRLKTGQSEVNKLYRFTRKHRSEEWQDGMPQHLSDFQATTYGTVPSLFRLQDPGRAKPDNSKVSPLSPTSPKQSLPPASHAVNISTVLADMKIRMQVASGDLKAAFGTMATLAKSSFVPHYKTINKVLKEMIRVYNHHTSSTTSAVLSLHLSHTASLQHPSLSRNYHSSVPVSDVPTIIDTAVLPWTQRTLPWLSNRTHHPDTSEKSRFLTWILQYLNQNNIHHSTIHLLSKLAISEKELEVLWDVAQRAKHPKTIIQRAQKYLVEAGCKSSLSTLNIRHIRLSKGLLLIMRLERMGIPPSKESILTALTASVNDGNLPGARALLARLDRYGFTLQPNEAANLVKCLPSMGMGTLSTAAGEVLSAMYVRSEQLVFLVDMRKYFTDTSYIGPYVLALGRCGSAVEIRRVWQSVVGEKMKDGVVTAFVEGCVLARDLASAMELIRDASRIGYPVNFWRARAVAEGLRRGQWQIALDLLREMILQRVDLREEQMQEILLKISEHLRKHAPVSVEDRKVFVNDLGIRFIEEMKSLKYGTDLGIALEQLGQILEQNHI